jgi:hypothetical protein
MLAAAELSRQNQELVDNLLIDHFSTNQLFASSSKIIFSQIASIESRLSETALSQTLKLLSRHQYTKSLCDEAS